MATVIDSLLITLGLDPKGFKKGAKEVTDAENQINKTTQNTEQKRKQIDKDQGERQRKYAQASDRHNKKQIESFDKIKHQLLGIMGAYIGLRSLQNFAMNSIMNVAGIERLSEVIGMSTREISAWGLAAKSIGGDAKEMSGELLKAQNTLGAMRLGQAPGAYQAYLRYGGDVSKLTDTMSYLLGIAQVLHHMEETPRLRASMPYVASQMGVGYSLMQLLKQGPGSVSKMITQYEKIANVTREQGEQSARLQKSMALTGEAWQQTGRILLNDVNPYLIQFFNSLKEFSEWANKHKAEIKKGVDTTASFFSWFDLTTPRSGMRESLNWLWGPSLTHPYHQMNQSETRIDTINIHTQANDANGIANTIKPAIKKQFGVQSNSGVE